MSSRTADNVQARTSLEKERLKRQGRDVKAGLTPVKLYLVAYNLVSAALWAQILVLTVSHFLEAPSAGTKMSNFAKFLAASPVNLLPDPIKDFLARLSNAYDYHHLGQWVKWTQTLAVMEVVHAATGLVRSPVATTAMQVASRLWTVWGVVEVKSSTHSHPLFSTMLFAWSVTEVVRYTFYATSVLGVTLPGHTWLRYTTFLPLYPLGAASEAFLSLSAVPPLTSLPFLPVWVSAWKPMAGLLYVMPNGVRHAMLKTKLGKATMWFMAKAAGKGSQVVLSHTWTARDYLSLVLFFGWWPALFVLYTHMLKQRRKFVSGPRKTVAGVNKTR